MVSLVEQTSDSFDVTSISDICPCSCCVECMCRSSPDLRSMVSAYDLNEMSMICQAKIV